MRSRITSSLNPTGVVMKKFKVGDRIRFYKYDGDKNPREGHVMRQDSDGTIKTDLDDGWWITQSQLVGHGNKKKTLLL